MSTKPRNLKVSGLERPRLLQPRVGALFRLPSGCGSDGTVVPGTLRLCRPNMLAHILRTTVLKFQLD